MVATWEEDFHEEPEPIVFDGCFALCDPIGPECILAHTHPEAILDPQHYHGSYYRYKAPHN